ncbi:MAG: SDR family oxidoreductase [Nocardioides sp.]|uniref:SDR family NAD(P)-dependent oxidoreductase n=1 Tax=Nocardioides sp. TaxID=35761 RepID=UPI0039E3A6E1
MASTKLSDLGTALITGATSGIGHEFARQLASRGHDLILVARDRERLDAVAADLGSTYGVSVEVLPADLADRDQLLLVEQRLAEDDRPVDLLVNNAGFGLKKRFLDSDIADEQAMIDVLVTAVMRLSHAALGAMAARGKGGLINVSSVASFLPCGTYSAAKAWVTSFGQWAANEYRSQGITVLTLCPGFTRTEFHSRMGVRRQSAPDLLWLESDFLVERSLADFDKGRELSIPGGQYKVITSAARVIPRRALQTYQSIGRR